MLQLNFAVFSTKAATDHISENEHGGVPVLAPVPGAPEGQPGLGAAVFHREGSVGERREGDVQGLVLALKRTCK